MKTASSANSNGNKTTKRIHKLRPYPQDAIPTFTVGGIVEAAARMVVNINDTLKDEVWS